MENEVLVIGTLNGCLVVQTANLKTAEVVGRVEGCVEHLCDSWSRAAVSHDP